MSTETANGAARPSSPAASLSARERLLAAANELFYEEGVHTVGIDRVIERAGVAKASLYSAFGSKEELVRSYLEGRQVARRERITRAIDRHQAPRERLLAVFDAMAESIAEPGFRGCAFARASAEGPTGTGVRAVCRDSRAWTRELFLTLSRAAGARDPEALTRQLVLLYDGASTGAQMDQDPAVATTARTIAETLLDAATGGKPSSGKTPSASSPRRR